MGFNDRNNAADLPKAPPNTGARFYEIPSYSDYRGTIAILEWEKLLPFPVRRMFYTYLVPTAEIRGEHAHKHCEQFLLALHGSLGVVADNGFARETFQLDSPLRGLHLPAGVWGVQQSHTPDNVLLVLASDPYDPDDYIRDYAEYLEYVKGKP